MENKVGEKRPRSPSLEGESRNLASVKVNPADQEDHGGQQHPLNPEILNQLATNATPEVRAEFQALLVPGHDHDHDDDQVAAAGQEQAPSLNPHFLNQIAAANANPELRAVIQALVPGAVGPLPPLQGEDHRPEEEEEEAVVGHEHEIAAAGQEIADHQEHGLHQGEHDVGAGDIGQGVADHQEYGLDQGDVVGAGDDIDQEDAAIGETQAQSTSKVR